MLSWAELSEVRWGGGGWVAVVVEVAAGYNRAGRNRAGQSISWQISSIGQKAGRMLAQ